MDQKMRLILLLESVLLFLFVLLFLVRQNFNEQTVIFSYSVLLVYSINLYFSVGASILLKEFNISNIDTKGKKQAFGIILMIIMMFGMVFFTLLRLDHHSLSCVISPIAASIIFANAALIGKIFITARAFLLNRQKQSK